MTTITLKNNTIVNFPELVSAVSQMETKELEQFLHQMSIVLARKKSPLSTRELELIDFVYKKFPLQEEYDFLQNKKNNDSLTEEEYQTLLILVEKSEAHNVEWLKSMIELAQIRAISLKELMLQLGFKDRHELLI